MLRVCQPRMRRIPVLFSLKSACPLTFLLRVMHASASRCCLRDTSTHAFTGGLPRFIGASSRCTLQQIPPAQSPRFSTCLQLAFACVPASGIYEEAGIGLCPVAVSQYQTLATNSRAVPGPQQSYQHEQQKVPLVLALHFAAGCGWRTSVSSEKE